MADRRRPPWWMYVVLVPCTYCLLLSWGVIAVGPLSGVPVSALALGLAWLVAWQRPASSRELLARFEAAAAR